MRGWVMGIYDASYCILLLLFSANCEQKRNGCHVSFLFVTQQASVKLTKASYAHLEAKERIL